MNKISIYCTETFKQVDLNNPRSIDAIPFSNNLMNRTSFGFFVAGFHTHRIQVEKYFHG